MAYDPEYYRKNRERWRHYDATRREKHREAELERVRTYKQANKQKISAYNAQYRKDNPDKIKASNARARARRRDAARNDFSALDWQELLVQYGCCAYCGATDKALTQDHKIPLTRGGDHTMSNIVPACGSCNSRKHTKTVSEYRSFKEEP